MENTAEKIEQEINMEDESLEIEVVDDTPEAGESKGEPSKELELVLNVLENELNKEYTLKEDTKDYIRDNVTTKIKDVKSVLGKTKGHTCKKNENERVISMEFKTIQDKERDKTVHICARIPDDTRRPIMIDPPLVKR